MIKLIALDISSTAVGVAVYKNKKLSEHFVQFGNALLSLKKTAKTTQDERFLVIKKWLLSFLNEQSPNIVVVESALGAATNIRFIAAENRAIGVVEGYCLANNAKFFAMSDWRKYAATPDNKCPRKRNEAKQWGKDLVKSLHNIDVVTDDESDAILIGLGYLNKIGTIEAAKAV